MHGQNHIKLVKSLLIILSPLLQIPNNLKVVYIFLLTHKGLFPPVMPFS